MEDTAGIVKRVDARGRRGKDEETVEDRWPDTEVISDGCQNKNAILSGPHAIDLDIDEVFVVVSETSACTPN